LLVSAEGAGIWDLLDRDRDGVLGLREVRAAPALLAALDRDGNGQIDKAEIVPSYQLVLAPGQASFRRLSGETVVVVEPAGRLGYPPEQLGGGPSWFRKMDRNEDGELSPREFLGNPDDFKKLDLDGDGVISREEADAAEKLRRR
jgi:hypothetical protein